VLKFKKYPYKGVPMQIVEVKAERPVPLRHKILRPEMPLEASIYPEDHLPGTLHLAAFDGEALVGCATALPKSPPGRMDAAYQLRGMAVEALYRNQGLGAQLLQRLETAVAARGITLMWCNGRTVAQSFYERAGWRTEGDEFDLVGIPHFVMVKMLAPSL
jgi:GNAT superfamily N-acetyltransferase